MRSHLAVFVAVGTLVVIVVDSRPDAQSISLIRTIAGGGANDPGDGGPAVDATLANPGGLARDVAGNLFIADTAHNRVRKLEAATGIITTVAGTGVQGFSGDGGQATAATLNAPTGAALDTSGNLYIGDSRNNAVRMVSAATGIIQTIAGTPPYAGFCDALGPFCSEATDAPLDWPTGVAVDLNGNVYIADTNNHRIRRVHNGQMVTFAGSSSIPAIPPRATCPMDVLWRLTPHTPGGEGGYSGDGGPAVSAQLRCPTGVSFDSAGNVYIADRSNHAIRKVTGGIITTIAGGHWEEFSFMGTGRVCSLAGDGGLATAASLCDPVSVTVDSAGNVFIADMTNNRVRMVAPRTGVITTIAGSGVVLRAVYGSPPRPVGLAGFSGDGGPATNALMKTPTGIIVDPVGNLYVADSGNNRIRSIVFSDVFFAAPLTPMTPAQLDGDRLADFAVWAPLTGRWTWLTAATGFDAARAGSWSWGRGDWGDVPITGDVDGDGIADLLVYRSTSGVWYWLTSSSGFTHGGSRLWGVPSLGDRPMLADMDGDGIDDMIVWRPGTGVWYWLTSASGYDATKAGSVAWGSGSVGDIPLLGDFDGDGRADVAVWRPTDNTFYWLNSSTGTGGSKQWGVSAVGDMPMVGDFDADHRSDLVVWRPGNGTFYWVLSSLNYSAGAAGSAQWGVAAAGDTPSLADMDGDGKADLIVWRTTTSEWFWLNSSAAYSPSSAGHVDMFAR